jgi:hypothetical protein
MSKTRFLGLVLSSALVLAAAPAVMAQDESPAPDAAATAETWDPANVPEFQQDEALIAYALFREELLAMGVAEEDLGEATAYLEGEAQAEVTDEADEVAEEVTEAEEEVQDEKSEVQDEKDEVQEEMDEAQEEVQEAKDKAKG